MNELIESFRHFLLEGLQAIVMREEFQPVLTDADLANRQQFKEVISNYKGVAGIYFWVLRYKNAEYKIYIGKTDSLSRRISDYVREFQPHSPNDYKLHIFHAFLIELFPTAMLDLYFAKKDLTGLTQNEANAILTQAETDAIKKYDPLLYKLPPPTAKAINELKKAFSLYYRSALEQKLKQKDAS